MEVQYGALQEPKPGSDANHCQDAFAYSDAFSVAAVCDGAGTAFESRRWARLLSEGFVEHLPFNGDASDPIDLLGWTDSIAAQWSGEIPWDRLNVYEQLSARSGSSATLVGLQLTPSPQQAASGKWRCVALGDSCLFQIRQGKLFTALPLKRSADFTTRPRLLSTERSNNEQAISQFVPDTGDWREGDIFFLLTDAIAQWFLREGERGAHPWAELTKLDEVSFPSFVQENRARDLMRGDDVTAFMIGLGVPLSTCQIPAPVRGRVPGAPGRPPRTPAHRAPTPAQPPTRSSRRPSPLPHPEGRRPSVTGPPSRKGGPGRGADPARPVRFDSPPNPESPDGPSRSARRKRTTLIAAGLAICVALVTWLSFVIGGSPQAPPVVRPVPPVMPEATSFAELLANYPGSGGTYQAYLNALGNNVVGGNPTLVAKLAGLGGAPPDNSVSSQGSVARTAIVKSSRSRAELYVLVDQTLTVPHTYTEPYSCKPKNSQVKKTCYATQTKEKTTARSLLVHLFMTRHQQQWLVRDATVSVVSPASGALSAPGSTG